MSRLMIYGKKGQRACPFADQSLSIDRSINAQKFLPIKVVGVLLR